MSVIISYASVWIVHLLQRHLPITMCAGSILFDIMSATLGIEGGFKANALLESVNTSDYGRIPILVAGEELVDGDSHPCCLPSVFVWSAFKHTMFSLYIMSNLFILMGEHLACIKINICLLWRSENQNCSTRECRCTGLTKLYMAPLRPMLQCEIT
jgi:hypothetical protein